MLPAVFAEREKASFKQTKRCQVTTEGKPISVLGSLILGTTIQQVRHHVCVASIIQSSWIKSTMIYSIPFGNIAVCDDPARPLHQSRNMSTCPKAVPPHKILISLAGTNVTMCVYIYIYICTYIYIYI